MAQTVEEILREQLGNLVMQISIKEHLLQTAKEKVQQLEDAAAAAKEPK